MMGNVWGSIGLPVRKRSSRYRVPGKKNSSSVRSEVVAEAPFQARLTLLGRIEPAARLEVRSPAAGRIRYPRRFAAGLRTGERVAAGQRRQHRQR